MRDGKSALVLAGRLEAIPLADVLQVLAAARHDGVLIVEGEDPGLSGEFELVGGRVVRAGIAELPDRLGTLLVGREQLDPRMLDEAVRRQSGAYAAKPLGTVLLEMGVVEPTALAAAVVDQIGDDAATMLSWSRGVFRFRVVDEAKVKPSEPRIDVAIEPRELLMEAARRLDES